MSQKELWPGWETVRVIGSGGFGKVYEIRKSDGTGDYPSALKVITIPQSPDEYSAYVDDGYDEKSITAIFKSQIDDIVSEFQMMAQFKGTSNIVSYEEHMIVPHEDGHGWDILIRMELLTSLPDYFNQRGMSEADVIKLGMDICRALELCAQKNIIHRDIKPQNIFVNAFGDFKLGDFGIARTMEHTTKATKIGTYNYMAPEVYQGRPYNATADLYSLGLTMYWLLNERRLPFQPLPPAVPTAAQNSEAQSRRLSGEPFNPPKNVGNGVGQVILKACAAIPANRYRSASEMRTALANVQLAHEQAEELAPEDPNYEKRKLHCENCGAVITEKTAVCPNCGYETGVTVSRFDTICKKCGCTTPAGLECCTACGAVLREEPPEPEQRQHLGGGAAPKRFCVTCGLVIPEGEKSCPICSKKVRQTSQTPPHKIPRRFCTNCGRAIPGDAAKCPFCVEQKEQETHSAHRANGSRMLRSTSQYELRQLLYRETKPYLSFEIRCPKSMINKPFVVDLTFDNGEKASFKIPEIMKSGQILRRTNNGAKLPPCIFIQVWYADKNEAVNSMETNFDNLYRTDSPSDNAKNDKYVVCPLCNGSKHYTYVDGRGFIAKFFEDKCHGCNGAGVLPMNAAADQLFQEIGQLRSLAANNPVIKKDCPVCHGLGKAFMRMSHVPFGKMRTQILTPCPMCHGKSIRKGKDVI